MISFNVPPYIGKEQDYIMDAINAHKICGDGQFTKKCNAWIEEKMGAHKALLTTSGSTALDMAAILTDVGPGDEVILPSFTFVSTANAFVLRGAKLVFVPAQFNLSSGPKNWELLLRARAVDYQLFVAGAQAARNEAVRYQCWGHSAVYDPAGVCLARAGEGEEILYAELDLARIEEERALLPVGQALRRDLYTVSE